MRLDIELINRKLAQTRQRAQGLISAGLVFVDGKKAIKASQHASEESKIEIKGSDIPYVGRGGLKLEKALKEFNIDVKNKICADIGASTGGFTDCLLQHGAAKVYAIDVGYGQLDWKLRNDPRVAVMEKVNARGLEPSLFEDNKFPDVNLIVIDVPFISLKLILPAALKLFKDNKEGGIIALIKPQFEVGKGEVGKGGIVREEEKRKRVINEISAFAKELGFDIIGITESPIKGAEGNIEYLIYLRIKKEAGKLKSEIRK